MESIVTSLDLRRLEQLEKEIILKTDEIKSAFYQLGELFIQYKENSNEEEFQKLIDRTGYKTRTVRCFMQLVNKFDYEIVKDFSVAKAFELVSLNQDIVQELKKEYPDLPSRTQKEIREIIKDKKKLVADAPSDPVDGYAEDNEQLENQMKLDGEGNVVDDDELPPTKEQIIPISVVLAFTGDYEIKDKQCTVTENKFRISEIVGIKPFAKNFKYMEDYSLISYEYLNGLQNKIKSLESVVYNIDTSNNEERIQGLIDKNDALEMKVQEYRDTITVLEQEVYERQSDFQERETALNDEIESLKSKVETDDRIVEKANKIIAKKENKIKELEQQVETSSSAPNADLEKLMIFINGNQKGFTKQKIINMMFEYLNTNELPPMALEQISLDQEQGGEQ